MYWLTVGRNVMRDFVVSIIEIAPVPASRVSVCQ